MKNNIKYRIRRYKINQFCEYMANKYKTRAAMKDICEGMKEEPNGYRKDKGGYYIPLKHLFGQRWHIVFNDSLCFDTNINKDICDFFNIEYKNTEGDL